MVAHWGQSSGGALESLEREKDEALRKRKKKKSIEKKINCVCDIIDASTRISDY